MKSKVFNIYKESIKMLLKRLKFFLTFALLTLTMLNMSCTSKEKPSLPKDVREKLEVIRTERQRIEKILPKYVESLALPGEPFGRFKFHKSQKQPWLLYASQQMFSLCVRHGIWDKLDETHKQQWLELILSAQDPKSGLFICPVAGDQPANYYRSITVKMARRLKSIGIKPRYPLPEAEVVCPRYEELPERLTALPWETNVYSAGAKAGFWAATRLDELESRGKPIEGDTYVMRIVEFLEQKQNPTTGFWGTSPNPADGMNGLLKSIGPFKRLDRPVPHAELIVGSILKAQLPDGSFGNACSPWNAMELLTFFAGQVPDRQADIQRAGLKLSQVLSKRRQPDGLYSANDAGCLHVHAGVQLCEQPMPISDLVGTSQTLSIIKMIESLFDPATCNYNVRQFGAKGDSATLDTKAIQKAIDACTEVGGGTVHFPPGTYKAGTIYLKSNVTLHLQAGATLLQSRDLNDYVQADCETSYICQMASHHAFLHGNRVTDVAIIGKGTIHGRKGNMVIGRDPRGPISIFFENSRNILIQDITIVDSPSEPAVFFGCKHVNFIRVTDLNGFAGGTTFTCCQDVLVDGVLSDDSGDDPICIKNGSAWYSYETRPDCGFLTENIIIKNTTIRNTSHPAIKIGTGSYGVFRNIVVENCILENTGDMFAIQLMRPKYEQTPERVIENISLSNIMVKNVGKLFDVTSIDVNRPIIRNILIDNITVAGICEPSLIYGLPGAPIVNFTISNMKLKGGMNPHWLKCRHVNGLNMNNIQLELNGTESVLIYENGADLELNKVNIAGTFGKGPLFKLNQVKGVSIRSVTSPAVGTFLHARGNETSNISFANNDLSKVKIPFEAGLEVYGGAVSPLAENITYTNLYVSDNIKSNEQFKANITITNTGTEGVARAEVRVNGEPAGARWYWLKKGESRKVTLTTKRYYKAGNREITIGLLKAIAVVEATPTAFHFGEKMKINSPAAAGALTIVTVPLKNIGGQQGAKNVEFYADGKVVASKSVTLAPGEEQEVTIEHRFKQVGPHKLKIGDFPVWPFATFSNTKADFYLTRNKIIIEAGGGRYDIRKPDREYGAVYLKNVKGDFSATTTLLKQQVTGPYAGGGLMVKNNMTKPTDDSGCVIAWRWPKYNVASFEQPMDFQITKTGEAFKGAYYSISPGDAEVVQDVGIFVNANSAKNEQCRVEFQHFTVEQKQ